MKKKKYLKKNQCFIEDGRKDKGYEYRTITII